MVSVLTSSDARLHMLMMHCTSSALHLQAFPARSRSPIAADMALESAALFQKKVSQFGLNEFQDQFVALGWTNLAEFAFSANHQPGSPDDSAFIDEVNIDTIN